VPPPEECRKRLGTVLSVLYLIFTEGSTASSGSDLMRPDLAREAVRLTRILARLVPDQAEVHGTAALAQAGRVGRGLGPYGVQAAIAECHERARAHPSPAQARRLT
jgi:predicted RNA polymerase sigma factor